LFFSPLLSEPRDSVAEHLGWPFVTAIATLPINLDASVPFVGFPWGHGTSMLARFRNRLGNACFEFLMAPVHRTINERRRAWRLPVVRTLDDYYSRRAQVAQVPAEFDFPGRRLPPHFHYTGPFTDGAGRTPVEFPWSCLKTDRPLVFASMGTLQNGLHHVFHTIAAACAGLGVQLVLSLGGGLEPEALGVLGDPVVVRYAPQLELIRRATLTITHGGLNSVLESLAEGVPLVALPVTNDQPGVGARVAWSGTGKAIPLGGSRIEAGDGLGRAAEIVEVACGAGDRSHRGSHIA
jgi:UDP:flavonoid glycosyltransferase YjiC (YdhE family)